MVSASTLLTDTILWCRDFLKTNLTDPIVSKRASGEKWIMTSYPKENVTYPIITVVDDGATTVRPLGMQSTMQQISFVIQFRIWARNVAERDSLFNNVYDNLRTKQFSAGGSQANNLHDFRVQSIVNVDEEGENGIKSKLIRVRYMYITE
jgi:hypothetical protein